MPGAIFPQQPGHGELLALDARQAAGVVLLRADQSALPESMLFTKIRPAAPAPGVMLPGHPAEVQLTGRLAGAALGPGPVTVSVSVQDADGNVYALDAGPLPADGRDHTLTVTLGNIALTGQAGGGQAVAGGA